MLIKHFKILGEEVLQSKHYQYLNKRENTELHDTRCCQIKGRKALSQNPSN